MFSSGEEMFKHLVDIVPKNINCCCGCGENAMESKYFCANTYKRTLSWHLSETAEKPTMKYPCRGCNNDNDSAAKSLILLSKQSDDAFSFVIS